VLAAEVEVVSDEEALGAGLVKVVPPSTASAATAPAIEVFRAGRSNPRMSGDMIVLLGTPAKVDLSD
jgi:hypothetical protein